MAEKASDSLIVKYNMENKATQKTYGSFGIAVLYGRNSLWYIEFGLSVSKFLKLNLRAFFGILCLNSVYFFASGSNGTEAITSPDKSLGSVHVHHPLPLPFLFIYGSLFTRRSQKL